MLKVDMAYVSENIGGYDKDCDVIIRCNTETAEFLANKLTEEIKDCDLEEYWKEFCAMVHSVNKLNDVIHCDDIDD